MIRNRIIMELVLTLLLLLLIINEITTDSEFTSDTDLLTESLIESLRVDPYLQADPDFSPHSKQYVDRHINNYKIQIRRSRKSESSRNRRNVNENGSNGTDSVELKRYNEIPVNNCLDLVLFEQEGLWYAASIEDYGSTLNIRKYEENKFSLLDTKTVVNGTKLGYLQLNSSTIIVVAENREPNEQLEYQTSIYQLKNNHLETIQKINESFSEELAIWKTDNDIFMTLVKSSDRTENITVYKWIRNHFDVAQNLEAIGSFKVSPFSVEHSHFLALAHSKKIESEKIFAEILKYDEELKLYRPFQKILTYACSDIKYFRVRFGNVEDHYLIAANFYKNDLSGNKSYNTISVIYKYIEEYFIPFQTMRMNGIKQIEPVMMDGDTVLLALTLDGVKALHYNGWSFVEKNVSVSNSREKSKNITAIQSYRFRSRNIIILLGENSTSSSMFEMNYAFLNEVKAEHDEMLSWCQNSLKKINSMHEDSILGEPVRGDITEEVPSFSQKGVSETDNLVFQLKKYEEKLAETNKNIDALLQINRTHIITKNITANEVFLEHKSTMVSPNIDTINEINIAELMSNTINVNEGFEINNLNFETVRVEESIHPKKINHHDGILHRNKNLNLDNLNINGSAAFKNKLTTSNSSSIDLVNDDLTDAANKRKVDGGMIRNRFKTIKASSITVGGLINDLDVPTLNKYAFRKSGGFNTTKTCIFDDLTADNLNTRTLSEKRPESIVLTVGRNYTTNKNVIFHNDVDVNNLQVDRHLNNISVLRGKLDVLLKNTSESQYISGVKSFQNLKLLNEIHLQGKIVGKQFEDINPLVKVDINVSVEGDVTITGNVTVEEIIKSKDMIPTGSTTSLSELSRFGLPLNSQEVPLPLNLQQHVDVKNINVESVNFLDIRSLVVNGADRSQIITGKKVFFGDLEINGDSKVVRINGIDLEELENNVLMKEGDQIITGRHMVEVVSAGQGVKADAITFGEQRWEDVMTANDDQIISAPTIVKGNINIQNADIKNLIVDGLVNNVNISEVQQDAVLKSNLPLKVLGEKSFKNLHIQHLNVAGLEELLNGLSNGEIHLMDAKNLRSVTAEKIHFEKSFNELDKDEFQIPKDEQIVIEDIDQLGTLKVFGKMYVKSNRLGDISLKELVEDTIKIDEAGNFSSATFENIRVNSGVDLKGEIENLDLDNIWQNGIEEPQTITDKKIIRGKITAEGNVLVENTINGRNISELCRFVSDDVDKLLIVKGNATFAKGPNVLHLNGHDLERISKSLWFVDQPTVFNDGVEFGDIIFKDSVTIHGLLNDVDLSQLSNKYLSKTKNQSVPVTMIFTEDVIFEDDVAAPNLLISGTVNDLDFEDFRKNILLNRDQLFEDMKYFENFSVSDIKGEFLLNGLNPTTDILRFDKDNKIVGSKRFKNLNIDNLHLERNVTIQGVHVDWWLKKAMLNEGTFKISGAKRIGNATFLKELGVAGKLNGDKFNKESVMTSTTNQNIVGKKVFRPQNPEGIRFKSLKVKGLINDTDIMDLVKNQASKNGDNVFTSEVNFTDVVKAKNVNFDKLYKGINISELVANITELGSLDHISDYYMNLLNRSQKIEESLKSQAFYLDHYKQILHHYKPIKILASTFNEREAVISYHCENYTNIATFLEWDDKTESFIEKEDYTLQLGPPLAYVSAVQYFGNDYIYMESEDANPQPDADHTHIGHLLHFENAAQFHNTPFLTKGTRFLESFFLADTRESCLLFIDYNFTTTILCSQNPGQFDLRQLIANEKAHMASILDIDNSTYLVTISSSDNAASKGSRTAIWKMNGQVFEVYQSIYRGDPISVSSVSYNQNHFLAVAYLRFEETMYFGMIEIFKFDGQSKKFTTYQIIKLATPVQVSFSVLPSEELVLYVVTEDTGVEAFNVYIYEGIFGFNVKVKQSILSRIIGIDQFSINDKHFVVAKYKETIGILQAVFKGHKIE